MRRAGPDRKHLGIGSEFEDHLATGAAGRRGRLGIAHDHDAAELPDASGYSDSRGLFAKFSYLIRF